MNKVFDKLSEDWHGLKRIAVFGFGKLGQSSMNALGDRFKITKIIDNNKELRGKNYKGIEIVSLEEYVALDANDKIVVVTSGKGFASISEELKRKGYKEYIDFCDFITFCSDYFWNDKKELFLGELGLSITTFCSLNCKNCLAFVPYNKKKRHFSVAGIKKDTRLIFEIVDYVSCLTIVGGEPLLYDDLEELIRFIGDNYRDYIGKLRIITNGTLKIGESLLNTMKEYNVEVRISDYTEGLITRGGYSKHVNYREKLKDICNDLDKHCIDYVRYENMVWLDMGFPHENVNMGDTSTELRRHMIRCNPNCQTVNEGKLYYCGQGWGAEQSGLFQLKVTDYLDLEAVSDCPDRKEQFRRFYFGGIGEEYFSFCKVCRGWESDIKVPGGLQYTPEELAQIKS